MYPGMLLEQNIPTCMPKMKLLNRNDPFPLESMGVMEVLQPGKLSLFFIKNPNFQHPGLKILLAGSLILRHRVRLSSQP